MISVVNLYSSITGSVKSFLGFSVDRVNSEIRQNQPTVVKRMENQFHLTSHRFLITFNETSCNQMANETANQDLMEILSAFTIWQSCSDTLLPNGPYDTSIFVTSSGSTAVLATSKSICEKIRITAPIELTGKRVTSLSYSGGLTSPEHRGRVSDGIK
jgi:hypothetical protein